MKYTKGYKIQVDETFSVQTPICPQEYIDTWDLRLDVDGLLTIKRGFGCDGPSGPTIPTKNSIEPSTEHDAFYKLMRKRLLPISFRPAVDKFFRSRLIKKGMMACRANYWYDGVRLAGGPSAIVKKKIYKA